MKGVARWKGTPVLGASCGRERPPMIGPRSAARPAATVARRAAGAADQRDHARLPGQRDDPRERRERARPDRAGPRGHRRRRRIPRAGLRRSRRPPRPAPTDHPPRPQPPRARGAQHRPARGPRAARLPARRRRHVGAGLPRARAAALRRPGDRPDVHQLPHPRPPDGPRGLHLGAVGAPDGPLPEDRRAEPDPRAHARRCAPRRCARSAATPSGCGSATTTTCT